MGGLSHTPLAISIRQPFAELILTGEKTIEYRSRKLGRAMLHRELFLYVPMAIAWHAQDEHPIWDRIDALPRGHVVGMLAFAGCTHDIETGYWEWHIKHARRIPHRRPVAKPQPIFFRPW